MVSIHNTHEFHNYISSLPIQKVTVKDNTILSYIQKNYPNIYMSLLTNRLLFNKFNIEHANYTLFLPTTDFNYKHLINHLYKGKLYLSNNDQLIVVSEGGIKLDIKDGMVNNMEIKDKNIMLGNGIIHIL